MQRDATSSLFASLDARPFSVQFFQSLVPGDQVYSLTCEDLTALLVSLELDMHLFVISKWSSIKLFSFNTQNEHYIFTYICYIFTYILYNLVYTVCIICSYYFKKEYFLTLIN